MSCSDTFTEFTGWNGSVFMLPPSGPGQKCYNRTRQRSALPFNACETSPGCLWGCRDFLSWFIPHQMTGRSATGRGFYQATMNYIDSVHRMTDAHPNPSLSHLLWLQLKGPVCSKMIHQLQRLQSRSILISLSTLTLGQMIEDLFGSPCDTCSGYHICPVCCNIVRLWSGTYLSLG